jgi:hypothetical protein
VENGRLVVDEPVNLPEGTRVQLAVVDDADQLDDEDRRRLHVAIERGQQEIAQGKGVPAAQILAELRTRSRG